jgi:hypothetical protein
VEYQSDTNLTRTIVLQGVCFIYFDVKSRNPSSFVHHWSKMVLFVLFLPRTGPNPTPSYIFGNDYQIPVQRTKNYCKRTCRCGDPWVASYGQKHSRSDFAKSHGQILTRGRPFWSPWYIPLPEFFRNPTQRVSGWYPK